MTWSSALAVGVSVAERVRMLNAAAADEDGAAPSVPPYTRDRLFPAEAESAGIYFFFHGGGGRG